MSTSVLKTLPGIGSLLISMMLASLAVLAGCESTEDRHDGVHFPDLTDDPTRRHPPMPRSLTEPHEVFCFNGHEFWLYDTDGDGDPDWVYDVETGVWTPILLVREEPLPGDGVRVSSVPRRLPADRLFDMIRKRAPDVALPPDGGFASGAAPACDAALAFRPGELPAADVRFSWRSDQGIVSPEPYGGVRYEIFRVDDGDEQTPDLVTVRVVGTIDWVAAYLLDMGITAIEFPVGDGALRFEADPLSRAVFLNDAFLGFARRVGEQA